MKRPLRAINTRLFEEDIEELQRVADEQGTFWQVELRLLVHRALRKRRTLKILPENK